MAQHQKQKNSQSNLVLAHNLSVNIQSGGCQVQPIKLFKKQRLSFGVLCLRENSAQTVTV